MKIARIGIFGGTFNPVHSGHLLLASEAQEIFGLDSVVFVPSSSPPHKGSSELADAKARYEMTKLAIKSNPGFAVSEIEVERGGRSYSIETVDNFRMEYGKDTKIYFIIGMDTVDELDTWKDINLLFKKVEFIVGTRPGYIPDTPLRKGCRLVGFPGLEISSSDIRKRVSEGNSIKYMVPEAVEKYILDAGLYHGQKAEVNNSE